MKHLVGAYYTSSCISPGRALDREPGSDTLIIGGPHRYYYTRLKADVSMHHFVSFDGHYASSSNDKQM